MNNFKNWGHLVIALAPSIFVIRKFSLFRTLRSLWTYMERERKVDVKKLWDGLADLVVKTFVSGESLISQMCRSNLNNRYNAYELFGIDVLFDEFLKPWILEVKFDWSAKLGYRFHVIMVRQFFFFLRQVNISPSLHSSSPLDLAVKGPLVKDVMNIVGYHIPNKMSPDMHVSRFNRSKRILFSYTFEQTKVTASINTL